MSNEINRLYQVDWLSVISKNVLFLQDSDIIWMEGIPNEGLTEGFLLLLPLSHGGLMVILWGFQGGIYLGLSKF